MNEITFANAAFAGDMDVLRWLRENNCPWDNSVCYHATWKGHTHVVKWALEHDCPWDHNMTDGDTLLPTELAREGIFVNGRCLICNCKIGDNMHGLCEAHALAVKNTLVESGVVYSDIAELIVRICTDTR